VPRQHVQELSGSQAAVHEMRQRNTYRVLYCILSVRTGAQPGGIEASHVAVSGRRDAPIRTLEQSQGRNSPTLPGTFYSHTQTPDKRPAPGTVSITVSATVTVTVIAAATEAGEGGIAPHLCPAQPKLQQQLLVPRHSAVPGRVGCHEGSIVHQHQERGLQELRHLPEALTTSAGGTHSEITVTIRQ